MDRLGPAWSGSARLSPEHLAVFLGRFAYTKHTFFLEALQKELVGGPSMDVSWWGVRKKLFKSRPFA